MITQISDSPEGLADVSSEQEGIGLGLGDRGKEGFESRRSKEVQVNVGEPGYAQN